MNNSFRIFISFLCALSPSFSLSFFPFFLLGGYLLKRTLLFLLVLEKEKSSLFFSSSAAVIVMQLYYPDLLFLSDASVFQICT